MPTSGKEKRNTLHIARSCNLHTNITDKVLYYNPVNRPAFSIWGILNVNRPQLYEAIMHMQCVPILFPSKQSTSNHVNKNNSLAKTL